MVSGKQQSSDLRKLQAQLRQQLEARRIRDPRVLDAIERTRRELFVPENVQHQAYDDNALPIGHGQTISQPYIVALMTEALALRGTKTVLEIGTGSGYQTAILAQLAQAVVTVERIGELSHRAQVVLGDLGFDKIEFRIGDGTRGCPDRAPYDGIIVTAAAPDVPEPLVAQLKIGGTLVIPVGNEEAQMLHAIEKQPEERIVRDLCPCCFVKLLGAAAWPDDEARES